MELVHWGKVLELVEDWVLAAPGVGCLEDVAWVWAAAWVAVEELRNRFFRVVLLQVQSIVRTALNKVNTKGWLGPALAVGGFGFMYGMNRAEGYSVPASLLKAGGETALYYMFPWLIAPQIVAGVAPVAVPAALDWTSKRQSFLKLAPNRGYIGGWYKDTRAAYTMRQQAAQAIESSFANVALGNEARMFYTG